MRIFSNLNLNGRTPARLQPKVGEWGPQMVPTTAAKKRMRLWAGLALTLTIVGVYCLGWFVYKQLTGQ